MKQEFIHLRRYPAMIAVVVFGSFSLFIIYRGGGVSLLDAFLVNPAFWLSIVFFIYQSDKIILTQTGIIKKNLFLKKNLAYEAVTSVQETSSHVILIGHSDSIRISRQMENFAKLYGLLLQQLPFHKTIKDVTFPFKISSRRGNLRELLFAADAITITTAHKRMRWKIIQLRKIQYQQTYHEIKPARGFNMSPDDYHALHQLTLSFHTGDDFVLGAGQLGSFGYSPERLALILRQLYPDKFFSNVYGKLVYQTQQHRDQAEAHLAWGDKLRREGQYEQAIDEYAAAISLNSEHRAYKHEIGNLLFTLERYDEAATAYRKMLTYFPDHEPSRERLSQCLLLLGQNKETEQR